jgi:peptidoglycan-N-acetylglucosamine deacetylase
MSYSAALIQAVFPSVICNTREKCVHLTFDDGPHPEATNTVLEILKERDIQATFFVIGRNVEKYPGLVERILTNGHMIGNHAYSHTSLFCKGKNAVKQEILQTEEILQTITGKQSRVFRPPYGYFNPITLNILNELKMKCVLWDVNSKDYLFSNYTSIESRVIPNTMNGSILLFHDNKKTAQNINLYLPKLLDLLIAKNLIFRKLPL